VSRNGVLLAALALATTSLAACGQNETQEAAEARPAVPAADAFCEEHQIAEAQCAWCNPELIETLGWCNGHDIPEAFCYRCNPALVPAFQAIGDWCAGHDRPESQCYICNPELDPARQEVVPEEAEASLGRPRPTQDVPRSQLPPAVYCSTQDLVVQFESPDISRLAGLQYARAEQRRITQTIECNARLDYDGDRYAHLSSQVPGTVAKVHHDLGAEVTAGDPLLTISSAQLGGAKAAYLLAHAAVEFRTKNHARERDLLTRSAGTELDLLEAENALAESRIALSRAEQELLRLGLREDAIERVARDHDTSPTYVLTAPFDGIVVERTVARGEGVSSDETLFAVADVSRMWALLDVYEADIPAVRPGQSVVLRVDGFRGQSVPGEITWVASHVDPSTRTLQVRAELDNPGGALKANMFASASVAVRDRHTAVTVPVDSVQWDGCCNIVFVKRTDVLYEPRKVLLGLKTGTAYEVLRGLHSGDEIVTQGSFLLKTELMKGSIGAGCCEVQPGT
jgi:cobalt-zinc-cadmium efflux system membrane fusion protein